MAKKTKKPTTKGNIEKAKAIHGRLETTSKKVSESSGAFAKEQKKVINIIGKLISQEDLEIKKINKELDKLDKSAADYDKKKDALLTIIKDSESKIDLYDSMGKQLDVSTKLTDKILSDLDRKGADEVGGALSEQILDLNKTIAKLRKTSGKSLDEVDIENATEQFADLLNEKQLTELNKKLSRLNKSLDFGMKSGLTESLVNVGMTGLFGAGGKVVSDMFGFTEKFDSLLRRNEDTKKVDEKTERLQEELLRRLEESETLDDDQKDRVKSRIKREQARDDEIQEDETSDYQDESLYLQREALHKTSEGNSLLGRYFTTLFAFLSGAKFLGGVSAAVSTALASGSMIGKAKGSVGNAASKAGKVASKASSNVSRFTRSSGLTGKLKAGGKFLGGKVLGPLGIGIAVKDEVESYVSGPGLKEYVALSRTPFGNKASVRERDSYTRALATASEKTGVPFSKLAAMLDREGKFNIDSQTYSYVKENFGSKYNITGNGGLSELALVAALSTKTASRTPPSNISRPNNRRNYLNEMLESKPMSASNRSSTSVMAPNNQGQPANTANISEGKQSIDDIDMIPDDRAMVMQVTGGLDE